VSGEEDGVAAAEFRVAEQLFERRQEHEHVRPAFGLDRLACEIEEDLRAVPKLMTHPWCFAAHSAPILSSAKETGFKPDCSGPIRGKISVEAGKHAPNRGRSALSDAAAVLTRKPAARILRRMSGLDAICGICRKIIG
jgi:hypothetical protein